MMAMAKSKASSSTKESAGKKQTGAKAGRGGAAPARGGRGGPGQAGGGLGGRQTTGTADEHYNLVSVLYHALKGAQTYAQYARDAEAAGDSELAEFFEDVQEEARMRAERAKELINRRLKGAGHGEEGEAQDE